MVEAAVRDVPCLKALLMVVYGFFVGFVSSIPIGAVQLEVIKKSINNQLKHAITVAAGSVTSDAVYGILVLFGIGGFLHERGIQIGVYALGIIVLSIILFSTYRNYRVNPLVLGGEYATKKHTAFFTGFFIAISNPGMFMWWIIGYKMLLDLNLFETVDVPVRVGFLVSCCAGLGGYLTFIAYFMNRIQKNISERILHRLNVGVMILLFLIICYFIVKIVMLLREFGSGRLIG